MKVSILSTSKLQGMDIPTNMATKAPPKPSADSGGITYDERETYTDTLEKAEPSLMIQNCLLAVACASVHDAPDTIRDANVMGFVFVADVDEKRRRLRILAPVSARLGDRPLLWGSWPEHMVNLLI